MRVCWSWIVFELEQYEDNLIYQYKILPPTDNWTSDSWRCHQPPWQSPSFPTMTLTQRSCHPSFKLKTFRRWESLRQSSLGVWNDLLYFSLSLLCNVTIPPRCEILISILQGLDEEAAVRSVNKLSDGYNANYFEGGKEKLRENYSASRKLTKWSHSLKY